MRAERYQHKAAKATVDGLDEAIRALESLGNHTGTAQDVRWGRARIAAAQRKRWAKLRLVKKK